MALFTTTDSSRGDNSTPSRAGQDSVIEVRGSPNTPFTLIELEAQTTHNGERQPEHCARPPASKSPRSYAEVVSSPPLDPSPYLATTIIIQDGLTQENEVSEQDGMEVGGEEEGSWKIVKSRKRALSISPTGHSPTDKKNKNDSSGSGASFDSSESAITYLENYALPPCPSPISPMPQPKPPKIDEPEYIWLTLSLPGKAPSAHQTEAIVKGFAQYIGPEKIKIIYQPVDRLGPSFKISRSEIAKARHYKNAHKHNFELVDFESALRPASGVGRKVNFQQSQTSLPTSTGILRNIAKDTNLLHLKNYFNSISHKVKQIDRIFYNGNPTENIKVTFFSSPPPLTITGDLVYDVFPTLIPYTRCNKCQEHGHKTDKCPKKNTICPHCSGNHNHYQCILNNNKNQKLCANCKGNHGAAFKKCPAFLQHKYMIDRKNNNINREWRKEKLGHIKTNLRPVCLTYLPYYPLGQEKKPPPIIPRKIP